MGRLGFAFALMSVCLMSTGAVVQPANTTCPCRTWVDSALHAEFPERLGSMTMSARTTYKGGDDDYSLRYDSKAGGGMMPDDRQLDLYVYTRDRQPMEDGTNEKVLDELDKTSRTVKLGMYYEVRALDMTYEGKLQKSGLTFYWTSYAVRLKEDSKWLMSLSAIFSWRNRFIKLRYSEPILKGDARPCETLPQSFADVAKAIDALIAGARDISCTDIYSIEDPAKALAAMRRKWQGVEDRVSMVEMPDYTERALELDRIQEWCSQDMKKRLDVFENVCLEGIRLKTEPPVWYYNRACVLALKGDKEGAILALEQAIAAGYNEIDAARKDADLKLVRDDARFEKLMKMAELVKGEWYAPGEQARVVDGKVSLGERNIYWAIRTKSYLVHVDESCSNSIFYLDHDIKHRDPPAEGMVAVEYAKGLHDAGRDVGAANFHFNDVSRLAYCPTLLRCAEVNEGNPTNDALSVYSRLCANGVLANVELRHLAAFNVLGVYGVDVDYCRDGVDKLMAVYPGAIAYYGSGSGDGIVRICADAYRAMPPDVREAGGIRQVMGLVRRGQKCVKTEEDYMSGIAQRPAICIDGIDRERVLELARNMKAPFPDMPILFDAKCNFEPTPITDLWNAPYDRVLMAQSCVHAGFAARWAEKTCKLLLNVKKSSAELVWRVLQGDAAKVRFKKIPKGKDDDGSFEKMEVEVDYHSAFEVALPGGGKVKTSRVDVGCFCVEGGMASMPVVVSVLFLPNETREYSDEGLLKVVDYSRRQLAGWLPWYCPKADFRDEFRWSKTGRMTGWTRTYCDGAKMDFTKDGLVVQSRDALGRPKDVRRSMHMEWMQTLDPFVTTGEVFDAQMASLGLKYDCRDSKPLETTLAWKYAYKDDSEEFGRPMPKDCRPFTYRPELCKRAEFSKDCGFRLPLMAQMMLGYERYCNYKYNIEGDTLISDSLREDGVLALKAKGLNPPKTLKKMRFCPWSPSTNDLWKIDVDEYESVDVSNLVEQADGVYRIALDEKRGKSYLSVNDTYVIQNTAGEDYAYEQLDAVFPRCDRETVMAVMADEKMELDSKRVHVCGDEATLFPESLPDGKTHTIGMWKISSTLCFCIVASFDSGMTAREYRFVGVEEKGNSVTSIITFQELPSRAIGNAVIGALRGDSEALNNYAVLLYAEVANPHMYDEAAVIELLRRAMELGNATAAHNLGVLYENRGEMDKAKQFYK